MSNPNSTPKTPKYIELIRQFTKKERTRFRQFLKNNCKDKNTLIVEEELNKSGVYDGKLYNEKIENKKIQKLKNSSSGKKTKDLSVCMRKLNEWAEQFLLWEGLERNQAYKQELLIKELLAKNQFSRAKFHIKKMEQSINSTTKSFEDYELAFKLEEVKNLKLLKEGLILKQDNFSELDQQLDRYYLLYKLRILSSILSIQNITAKKFTFNDNGIKSLQMSDQSDPLIKAYILINIL